MSTFLSSELLKVASGKDAVEMPKMMGTQTFACVGLDVVLSHVGAREKDDAKRFTKCAGQADGPTAISAGYNDAGPPDGSRERGMKSQKKDGRKTNGMQERRRNGQYLGGPAYR